MRNEGFTLIEVLIALFVFAILGTVTVAALHSVIQSYVKVKHLDYQLQRWQRTVTTLRRDIKQIVDRTILNEKKAEMPALIAMNDHTVEFTVGGYANPNANEKRSTLQRVSYFVENGALIRAVWPVLDRDSGTKVQRRETVLLKPVEGLKLEFVNANNKLVPTWTVNSLPKGIVFNLFFKDQMSRFIFSISET